LLKIRLVDNLEDTQEFTLAEFLYSKFNVIYNRGDTLFIDMNALERKRGRYGHK